VDKKGTGVDRLIYAATGTADVNKPLMPLSELQAKVRAVAQCATWVLHLAVN